MKYVKRLVEDHNPELEIDKSLNFQGQSAIINGVDNADPEVIPSTRRYRVTAAGLTITFNDITFQGSKNKVVNGSVLSLEQASTVSFTDCIFDNNSLNNLFCLIKDSNVIHNDSNLTS